MVPSTGLRTAANATFTARRKALATTAESAGPSTSARPSARPRRIWLVMTPELPRAPMREPCVTAAASFFMVASAGRASISATTVAKVRDMFVPVSPSGTGKTLSLFISSLRSLTA